MEENQSLEVATQTSLLAFARNGAEVQEQQQNLTAWAAGKVAEAKAHLDEMTASLELARSSGWQITGFQSAVREAQKKLIFYEKLHGAFEAGFCIIPNFPIDVFAVRTMRVAPKKNLVTVSFQWRDTDRTNPSENLSQGVGDYVSDQPVVSERRVEVPNSKGELEKKWQFWSEAFKDVDFPIKVAPVQVLSATASAMALKLFDEIGVLPVRRQKNNDPMIVGRINYKHGRHERSVSFVVAWFFSERDLEI